MQDFDFIGPLICEQKVKMIYFLYLLFAMHVKFSLNFQFDMIHSVQNSFVQLHKQGQF